MDFLSTVGVQELNSFAELSASYNAVVDKQELFTLDKLVNGNKLHLCNLVSHGLALRHEAAGPCGGVLYKWACERNAASVCVTDCVRNAGIRNAADEVNIGQVAALDIVFSHDLAVSGAHGLNGDSLVYRVGVAVVCPQEGADLEVVDVTLAEHLCALGRYLHDLAGEHFTVDSVSQLLECEALKGNTVSVVAPSYYNRKPAVLVPGSDDTVLGQDKQGHCALDLFLSILDSVDDVVALRDEPADERGRINLSAAHCLETGAGIAEQLVAELLSIVDYADVAYRVGTEPGLEKDRLRISIADAADAEIAFHCVYVALELCAERRVFNAVNASLEALLRGICSHTASACAEVRMIVGAEKYVADTVMFSSRSKKTAHIKLYRLFCMYQLNRGRMSPAPDSQRNIPIP